MTERAWPEDWADRMAGSNCPLCTAVGSGDNDFSVAVFTGEVAEVRLERRSRLPGYCTVVWKLGHVAEPDDLDPPPRTPTCTARPQTSAHCLTGNRQSLQLRRVGFPSQRGEILLERDLQ